jgi:CRP-like cAMP-binding protein
MSNRKPKKERIRSLREEALEHLRKGNHAGALVRFTELERLAPDVAEFPQRAADCQRALGNTAEQIEALGRAVALYADQGALPKAIALCRVVLGVDPGHARTLERLAELNGARQPLAAVAPPPLPAPPVRLPAISMPAGSVVLSSVPAGTTSTSAPGTSSATSGWARPRRTLEQMLRLRRAELAKAKLPTGEDGTRAEQDATVADCPSDSILAPEGPSLDSMLAPEPLPVFDSVVAPAPESALPAPDSTPRVAASMMLEPSASIPVLEPPLSEPAPESVSDSAITNRLPPPLAERVLPVTPLFSDLGPENLSVLISNAKVLHFEPGKTVYRQNDPSDRLFVVASGLVSIATEGENGIEIARLGENEFFGETALVSNELRLSTARALEPTSVLAVERKTMTELVQKDPRVLPTILRFLRERLVESMLLTNPLFTLLTGGERREFVKRFEFMEFDRGTLLVRQRSRSPGIFVLLCGTVEVTRREGSDVRLLALLHAGDVFGEMSLIGRDPAVADVRSMSRGFALMLPENEFRRACSAHSEVLEFVQLLAAMRKRQNVQPIARESVPANA